MKRITLYLLIFSALMNVFLYMYFTKREKHSTKEHQKTLRIIEQSKKTSDSLSLKIFDLTHYSLEGNDGSQDYFYKYAKGFNVEKIRDSILNMNHLRGGNTLVGLNNPDDPVIISRMQFLNHRWILADYDNKMLGGQILIQYYINEDGTFSLETLDKAIYLPKTQAND